MCIRDRSTFLVPSSCFSFPICSFPYNSPHTLSLSESLPPINCAGMEVHHYSSENSSTTKSLESLVRENNDKARPICCRNVYKSILRNLRKYTRNNRDALMVELTKSGYSIQDIEKAFLAVNDFKEVEAQKGNRERYKKLLEDVIDKNSIITQILKNSLEFKIGRLEGGNRGRIAFQNYRAYKRIYAEYYKKVAKILGKDEKEPSEEPVKVELKSESKNN
eukprot:TRINITY_DN13568_c0_g1_i10.p1 TRINITY_DN13568_c0_g1~~TRINITY_DN13568_c0_g1_i10.p1  ORF type:complete len:220 (+),score=31.95 TRINITY_DN13568_c0_g1_i10:70-729(+)